MSAIQTTLVAIVDDNMIYRKILSYILRTMGYQIIFEAEHGEQALWMMASVNILPDVIILDIEMPVMDGFATAKHLKSSWPQVKILGHSSREEPQTIAKILACGADLFLAKGYQPEELKAAIVQLQIS